MTTYANRRTFIRENTAIALGLTAAATTGTLRIVAAPPEQTTPTPTPTPTPTTPSPWPGFPHQDPALVREIVGASHRDPKRVKELLTAHPALAKASYDWGYGDWESALGAASHVGNREIAALLLEHGARLDIFAAAMLGMTDAVKALLAAQPSLARTRGPHGISLVAHAAAGDNKDLEEFLKAIDGAGDTPTAIAPLTPDEMKPYLGVYTRDNGVLITISQNRFGMAIKSDPATDVRLTRTGDHTFHPAGAPNVRIAFTVKDGAATRIEVVESSWLISATRRP